MESLKGKRALGVVRGGKTSAHDDRNNVVVS
jgi:hypothetical protein